MNITNGVEYHLSLDIDLNKIKQIETLLDLERYCLENYSDKYIFENDEKKTSYKEFFRSVDKKRKYIMNKFPKGEIIALQAQGEEFAEIFFAITTCGRTVLPLPIFLSNEVKIFLYEKKIRYIYCEKNTNIALSDNTKINIIGKETFENTETLKTDENCDVYKDDIAAVFLSGGTDGVIKGAMLSQSSICKGAINGIYIPNFNIFGQRYFCLLPLHHVFGAIRSLLTPIFTGSSMWFCSSFTGILREMKLFKPTIAVLVPALCELLLKFVKLKEKSCVGGDLQVIIAGGAAVDKHIILDFYEHGIMVYQGYGLTEASCLVSGNTDPLNKPLSVGKPYSGLTVKIVDGEIYIGGNTLMKGYLLDGKSTESSFDNGFFKTGDLGQIDDEGFIYITGLKKNMIVTANGENVFPDALAKNYLADKAIKDAIIYKESDKIVLKIIPSGKQKDEEEIKNIAEGISATIMPSQRPSKIIIERK